MADGAPARELAQRLTSGVEIVLLWHPGIDSLELVVHDPATGTDCHVEIAPEDAIEEHLAVVHLAVVDVEVEAAGR